MLSNKYIIIFCVYSFFLACSEQQQTRENTNDQIDLSSADMLMLDQQLNDHRMSDQSPMNDQYINDMRIEDLRVQRSGNCPSPLLFPIHQDSQSYRYDVGLWKDADLSWSPQSWQWKLLNHDTGIVTIAEWSQGNQEQKNFLLWQCLAPTQDNHSLTLPDGWQALGSAVILSQVIPQNYNIDVLDTQQLSIKNPLRLEWVYSALDAPEQLDANQIQLFWWPIPQPIQLEIDTTQVSTQTPIELSNAIELNSLSAGMYLPNTLQDYYPTPHMQSSIKALPLKNPTFDLIQGKVTSNITEWGVYVLAYRPARMIPQTVKLTYRAIAGISMGGGSSAVIASRHPDRFDYVGALGGVSDWIYMLDYTRRKLLGGFCTEQQRQEGLACPSPSSAHPIEQVSTYESWIYSDNGSYFDRDQYMKIFHDMSLAFGNPFSFNVDSPYLPPHVPFEEQLRSKKQRCQPECRGDDCDAVDSWLRLENFYDDEYNPNGEYPVILFCDGEDDDIPSLFNTEREHDIPTEVLLAVDLNDNGRRDGGEPVIRNTSEPFKDVGCDGLADQDEPGYHPLWNSDPHRDNFHWRLNPRGTEGDTLFQGAQGQVGVEKLDGLPASVLSADRNQLQKFKQAFQHLACKAGETGEPFEDIGLDGVAMTSDQAHGGYDWGEGNDAFDYNPNVLRFYAHNPAHYLYQALTQEDHFLRVWADGGIRDLFNFAITSMHLIGHLQGEVTQNTAIQSAPARMYDRFQSLVGDNYFSPTMDKLDHLKQTGWHVLLRYGNPQASAEEIAAGDGAHVGTNAQAVSRLNSFLHWTHRNWSETLPVSESAITGVTPDLNEEVMIDSPLLDARYHFVVSLPPGYYEDANQNQQYPVVYMLHGYGQNAPGLASSGLIFQSLMSSKIWPDTIFVYPEASCDFNRINACSDGVDNDGDGFIDLDDEGCNNERDRSEDEIDVRRCMDGVDNDLDGSIDLEDPGCLDATDDQEGDCRTGTFYATHSSWEDGRFGGRDYEGAFLDMMDYIDQNYRVLPPQDVQIMRP